MMKDYKHVVEGVSLTKEEVGTLELWNWAVEETGYEAVSAFALRYGYGNCTGMGKDEILTPCLHAITALCKDNGIGESAFREKVKNAFSLRVFRLNRAMRGAVEEARRLYEEKISQLKADGSISTGYDTEWAFRGFLGSLVWDISVTLRKKVDAMRDGDFFKDGLFSKYRINALGFADGLRLNELSNKERYSEYDVEAMLLRSGLYDNVDETTTTDIRINDEDSVDLSIDEQGAVNPVAMELYQKVKNAVYANPNRLLKDTKAELEASTLGGNKETKRQLAYFYAAVVAEWMIKED